MKPLTMAAFKNQLKAAIAARKLVMKHEMPEQRRLRIHRQAMANTGAPFTHEEIWGICNVK